MEKCSRSFLFNSHAFFSWSRYLIDIGADVNRKSVKGNTALHDCAESGSLEIMKLLLSSGANMDVDAYGKPNVCIRFLT